MKRRQRKPVLQIGSQTDVQKYTYESPLLDEHKQIFSEKKEENGSTNPLANLLYHYNTDSDEEESETKTKLNDQVDDFFKEIQSISVVQAQNCPPNSQTALHQSPWQECFDESTGYPYYWHIETNEVTWEIPEELKSLRNSMKMVQVAKPVFPNSQWLNFSSVKYQSLESAIPEGMIPKEVVARNRNKHILKKVEEETKEKTDDASEQGDDSSDEERIEMITSYGSNESESDSAEEDNSSQKEVSKVVNEDKKLKDSEVGPSLPTIYPLENFEVKDKQGTKDLKLKKQLTHVTTEKEEEITKGNELEKENKKPNNCTVPGHSSDTENETEIKKEEKTSVLTSKEEKLSVTKPEELHFIEGEEICKKNHWNKIFQKTEHIEFSDDIQNRKLEKANTERSKAVSDETNELQEDESGCVERSPIDKEFSTLVHTVMQKLRFLVEEKQPLSVIQIMAIQLQALCSAWELGCLEDNYFRKWIINKNEELEQLEKDATPCGWICKWDRSRKRYYYRNVNTGVAQWTFPNTEIAGGAEEMEICTTPPSTEEESTGEKKDSEPEAPPPPKISNPSPPPPPKILPEDLKRDKRKQENSSEEEDIKKRRLEEDTKKQTVSSNSQPETCMEIIPSEVDPGESLFVTPLALLQSQFVPCSFPQNVIQNQTLMLDNNRIFPVPPTTTKVIEKPPIKKESLGSELDSFYNDIASIEKTVPRQDPVIEQDSLPEVAKSEEQPCNAKEKKKKKEKVGISKKHKKMSSMVAQWQKAQKNLEES